MNPITPSLQPHGDYWFNGFPGKSRFIVIDFFFKLWGMFQENYINNTVADGWLPWVAMAMTVINRGLLYLLKDFFYRRHFGISRVHDDVINQNWQEKFRHDLSTPWYLSGLSFPPNSELPGALFTNMEYLYSHPAWISNHMHAGWNYLAIPKLQRLHRWSLELEKWLNHILYNGCNYLFMLGLKLIRVSKRHHPPPAHARIHASHMVNSLISGHISRPIGNKSFKWVKSSWFYSCSYRRWFCMQNPLTTSQL